MTKNNYKNEKYKTELSHIKRVAKGRLSQIIEEEYKKHEASFYKLTKREKEVLRFMALGIDSKKIANQLHISRYTVATHRKNIYKKTELKTMRDIVLFTLIFDMSL